MSGIVAGSLAINFESNGAALLSMMDSIKAKLVESEVIGSKATNEIEHGFESLLKSIIPVPPEVSKITGELGGMLGAGAGVLAVAGLFGALGVAAFEAGLSVNEAFRMIIVKTGETETVLAGLEDDFKAVFSSVPGTAKEAATAISELHVRLGLTGEALQALAAQELDLAHITGADLGGQVAATSKLFVNWGTAIQSPTEAMDFLFKVSQQTGIGVTQLSTTLAGTAANMRAVGITFEQGAALVGTFDKAGLDANQMMMGMSKAFAVMTKAGVDPIQGFQALIDKIKNTTDAVQQNEEALKIFGARGAAKFIDAIKSGRLEVGALIEKLHASTTTIEDVEEKTRTLGESFELFKNKVELLLAPLGQDLIQALKNAMGSMIGLLESNQAAIQAALDNLTALFKNVGSAIIDLVSAIGPTNIAFGLLGIAILGVLGPIGQVIAGLGLLTIAYAENYGQMGTIVSDFTRLFTTKTAEASSAYQIGFIDLLDAGVLVIIQAFDRVLLLIEKLAIDIVTFGKIMEASLEGNWSGITRAWEEGTAKTERVNSEWLARRVQTEAEMQAISVGGWRAHFNLLAAMSLGAGKSSSANFAFGMAGVEEVMPALIIKGGKDAATAAAQAGTVAGSSFSTNFFNSISKTSSFMGEMAKPVANPYSPTQFAKALGETVTATPAGTLERAQADINAKTQQFLNQLGKTHKAGGQAAGKAYVDGFTEGAAGLSKAVELIAGRSTAQLEHLMDPLSKGAKKNLAETQAALKAESSGINEWLSSIGAGAKLSEAQLAGSNKALRDELGASAVAWKNNQEIVNQWSLDLLRSTGVTVPQINAYLKSIGQESSVTATQLMNANQDTVKSLALAAKGFEDHSKSAAQDRAEVMLNYAEITKGELPLRDSTALFNLASEGILNHAKALQSATAFAQPWIDAVNRQKDSLVQLAAAINQYLAGDQDFLKAKAQVAALNEIDAKIKSVIDTWTALGVHAGDTGQKLVNDVVPHLRELGVEGAKAADALQKSLDKVTFDELAKKVNAAVNGITEIFSLIPGKFGDMAKEIQKVVNTVDKILKNLHAVFSQLPASIGEAIGLVIQHFKKLADAAAQTASSVSTSMSQTTNAVGQSSDNWVGDLEKIDQASGQMGQSSQDSSEKTVNAFSVMSSAIAGFASGISISAATGSKAIGAIGGAATGALEGFMIAGPWGALAGGIGGLLGGLLGGGKSAAQKATEAAQLQQLKQQVQQGALDIIKSAIDGFNSALAFFDTLDEFTAPRKAKFASFWKAMTRLMDGFIQLAGQWSADSLTKAKNAADAIKPIADTISALPAAFTAISGHFAVAESSFDSFFADFDKLMNRFFARADVWIEGQAKRAFKVADRLTPVVNLISPLVQGFKDLGSLTAPSDAMFDILDAALNTLVTRMDALTGKWDKALLKSIANFAEKIGPAVDLWKNAIETFKSMTDIPTPSVSDFNAIFYGIEQAINGMIALAGRVSTDGLDKADAIATASLVIFSTIKAAVEALAGLRDYVKIPSETFAALIEDFQLAVNLMVDGLAVSERFIGIAKTFEANIIEGAKHLANAVAIFTASIRNLGYGLAAFGVTVTLPGGSDVGTTSASGGSFAPLSRTSSEFTPSSVTSASSASSPIQQHITVNIDPSKFRDIAHAMAWLGNMWGTNTGIVARLRQEGG